MFIQIYYHFFFTSPAVSLGLHTHAPDEGQACRHLSLVLQVLFSKKENKRHLLFLNALPEKAPAGQRVAQHAHRVTEHHLRADAPVEPAHVGGVPEEGVQLWHVNGSAPGHRRAGTTLRHLRPPRRLRAGDGESDEGDLLRPRHSVRNVNTQQTVLSSYAEHTHRGAEPEAGHPERYAYGAVGKKCSAAGSENRRPPKQEKGHLLLHNYHPPTAPTAIQPNKAMCPIILKR